MAVAFSLSPIQFNQAIDGSSVGSLVSGLLSTLNDAGWVGSGITGGFKFTLVSPQNMQCKVKVWDDSSGNAAIQFLSVDEARIGFLHHLAPASGLVFQCWANVCQLFVSVAGKYIADPFKGPWFACGGIPFVPLGLLGSCGLDAGPVLANEIWWSCGDGSGTRAGVDSLSFRLSTVATGFSACYNGDLMNQVATGAGAPPLYSASNGLRLLPVAIALPWPSYFGAQYDPHMAPYGSSPPYADKQRYRFDPLLAWGSGVAFDGVAQQKGQIWDCYMGSVYAPVDDVETRLDSDSNSLRFVNYMGDPPPPGDQDFTRYSSLYLLVGSSGAGAIVPYMY